LGLKQYSPHPLDTLDRGVYIKECLKRMNLKNKKVFITGADGFIGSLTQKIINIIEPWFKNYY